MNKLNVSILIVIFSLITGEYHIYAQWTKTNAPNNITYYSLEMFGTNIYACSDSGLFRSTADDDKWIALNEGLTNSIVYSIGKNGNDLYACTDGGIFRSTNDGASWFKTNKGLTDTTTMTIAFIGSNIFIGTYGGGVFRSNDNGMKWDQVNNGLINTKIRALAAFGTKMYAATGSGVFISSNNGDNWTIVNEGMGTNNYALSLIVMGYSIFVGTNYSKGNTITDPYPTDGGLFVSTNAGTKWNYLNNELKYHSLNSFAGNENSFFTTTANGGLFLSINLGISWKSVKSNLPESYNNSIAADDTYIFVGTINKGIWRRYISEVITDVKGVEKMPDEYHLAQNYPNPFNPSTTIAYEIPTHSNVRIEVSDVLGRKIETLVNMVQEAGKYITNFHADMLSSGIYFYKITANNFIQTKKMILIR